MASKVKDGRWRICWRVNGKRKSIYLPREVSEREAKKIEAKIRLELIDPTINKDEKTLAEFIPEFIEGYEKVHNSHPTSKRFEYTAKKHLIPKLGHLHLSEVRPKHILDLQSGMNEKGFKAQTIGNTISAASKLFNFAVTKGLMDYNPTTSVKRVKDKVENVPPFWSFAERDKFLLYAMNHDWEIYQLVAFAVTTGLRPGELWGLKRDCLDFHNSVVTVKRNWCTKSNKLNEYTKNKKTRMVTVPPPIMQLLANKNALSSDDFVFSKAITFGNLSYRVLKPMAKKAGVTEIKFHDLRHTFASHCVLKGLHQVEIRDLLGHTKVSTTDKYMHLRDDDKKGLTDSLAQGMPWAVDHTPKVVAVNFGGI